MKESFQNCVIIHQNSQFSLSLNKSFYCYTSVHVDVYFAWNNYYRYSPESIPILSCFDLLLREEISKHSIIESSQIDFPLKKNISPSNIVFTFYELLCINEDAMTWTNLSSNQKAKSILFDVKIDWSDVTPNGMIIEVSKPYWINIAKYYKIVKSICLPIKAIWFFCYRYVGWSRTFVSS